MGQLACPGSPKQLSEIGSTMSKSKSEERIRLQVLLSEAMLVAIDDYRYSTRAPSRAEAIRRLLRKGQTAK